MFRFSIQLIRYLTIHSLLVSLSNWRGISQVSTPLNTSFSSPTTDVGSHNSPSFGAQRPRWHSFLSLIDVRSHRFSHHWMFHSPLQSIWDLTIHHLSGSSVLIGTRFSLQLIGISQVFIPLNHSFSSTINCGISRKIIDKFEKELERKSTTWRWPKRLFDLTNILIDFPSNNLKTLTKDQW